VAPSHGPGARGVGLEPLMCYQAGGGRAPIERPRLLPTVLVIDSTLARFSDPPIPTLRLGWVTHGGAGMATMHCMHGSKCMPLSAAFVDRASGGLAESCAPVGLDAHAAVHGMFGSALSGRAGVQRSPLLPFACTLQVFGSQARCGQPGWWRLSGTPPAAV
jgi:hypothetical protein